MYVHLLPSKDSVFVIQVATRAECDETEKQQHTSGDIVCTQHIYILQLRLISVGSTVSHTYYSSTCNNRQCTVYVHYNRVTCKLHV